MKQILIEQLLVNAHLVIEKVQEVTYGNFNEHPGEARIMNWLK
jgi:hypothetical protein